MAQYIPESERKIDNNREIHIPFDGNGLGETFFYTVLCKKNPNIVIDIVKKNPNAYNIASVFNNIAKFNEIETYIEKDFNFYKSRLQGSHAVLNILDCCGMETDDYIPYIKLEQEEIDFGLKFCSNFEKPCIVFCPISGGYSNIPKCSLALGKMLPPEKWKEIIQKLSKKYTILYCAMSKNQYKIENTIECFDFPMRIQCSIMRACGKFLGIESGLTHAAVASGAFCHVLVPSFGYSNGLLFDNFSYKAEMWKYETCRVKYYHFQNHLEVLNNL